MFIISVMAALCSTTASIPQILGNVSKLSNITMSLRGLGAILWCVYGILIEEYALVVSSSIAGLVELALIIKTNHCRELEEKPLSSDNAPSLTGAELRSFVSVDRVELQ